MSVWGRKLDKMIRQSDDATDLAEELAEFFEDAGEDDAEAMSLEIAKRLMPDDDDEADEGDD